jgi:hypothetical protein
MKKVSSIICAFVLILGLMSGQSFAIGYCKDYLEIGNPGGWSSSLKTFDESVILEGSETIFLDIWVNDVRTGDELISSGFKAFLYPSVNLVSVEVYDTQHGGPWDPSMIVIDSSEPNSLFVGTGNLACIPADAGNDLIIAKLGITGIGMMSIQTLLPLDGSVSCIDFYVYDYDISPSNFTIGESGDLDGDGIPDTVDNCPLDYNPEQIDTDEDGFGNLCDDCPNDPYNDIDMDGLCANEDNCPNHHNPNQEDYYPPGGNNCGDACECEGDFEPDGDVDGTDAIPIKQDFFRKDCSTNPPCNGDFNCDGDVDGTDVAGFRFDFFRKDCPSCGGWPCVYE